MPSVVGFSLDDAKIRVATDGLTVAIVERTADDPEGRRHRAEPGGRIVRRRQHQSASWSCHAGRRRCRSPMCRTLSPEDAAGAARGSRVPRHRRAAEQRDGSVQRRHRHRSADRREAAARLRDHVAREQRSRAGADPRNREHELRRSRASAHRRRASRCTRSDDFSDTVPVDKVIGTNPAVGTSQARGSTVTISVSKGPELVTVPDLTGNTLEAAQQRLVALGLEVDTVGLPPGPGRPQPVGRRESDGEEGHQGHVDLLSARRSVRRA